MAVINFKNTVLEIRGLTAGQKISIMMGNGNITWQEKRNREYIKDRGNLGTVRDGDDEPLSLKFMAQYEFITGPGASSTISIEDALKQRGSASSWVTTSPDLCEPYSVDLYFYNMLTCSGVQQELIVFPEFRYETLDHDPKAGTISIDGKCNVTQVSPSRGTLTT